jgi:VIT1/CCC1 family predicted Fe2+/Mn2+ transporter
MSQSKGKKKNSIYVRSFTFGVEDSLVSTVGLLSGVATAGVPARTVFLSGAILIVVEALSMATGSFLSEESAEEYESQRETRDRKPVVAAFIMFVSYIGAGIIPLLPYILYSAEEAFVLSIAASLFALFLLGFISAKLFKVNMLRKGLQMSILGALAITAGITIGQLLTRLV